MASKTLKFCMDKYKTILKVCKRVFLYIGILKKLPISDNFVDGPDKGMGIDGYKNSNPLISSLENLHKSLGTQLPNS